jgi:hypothetical protein
LDWTILGERPSGQANQEKAQCSTPILIYRTIYCAA